MAPCRPESRPSPAPAPHRLISWPQSQPGHCCTTAPQLARCRPPRSAAAKPALCIATSPTLAPYAAAALVHPRPPPPVLSSQRCESRSPRRLAAPPTSRQLPVARSVSKRHSHGTAPARILPGRNRRAYGRVAIACGLCFPPDPQQRRRTAEQAAKQQADRTMLGITKPLAGLPHCPHSLKCLPREPPLTNA